MGNEYITLPDAAMLKKKEGWNKDPKVDHRYMATRFHYLLRGPFQLDEPVRKGEVIGASTPLRGVTEKRVYTTEYEVTTVRVNELVKEALREIGDPACVRNGFIGKYRRRSAGENIKRGESICLPAPLKSFKDTFKVSVSDTHREKKSVTREYVIDPSQFERDATLVFVKAYKAFAYHLYLQFIDYLVVEYAGSPRSLKLKRTKLPPITTAKHPNILRVGLSLCSIRFWKELPQSSLLLEEKSYQNEVEDPDEIQNRGSP